MEIIEYIRENGSNPYKEWFDSLDIQAASIVAIVRSRLEEGNTSNIERLGDGISERKIDRGPGYRIYLAQEGKQRMILFGGGTKKNQQADIDKAKQLYQEYKERKKKTKKSQE